MGSSVSTLANLPIVGHQSTGCVQNRPNLIDLDQVTHDAVVTSVDGNAVTLIWNITYEGSNEGIAFRRKDSGTITIDYMTHQVTKFTGKLFSPNTVYKAIMYETYSVPWRWDITTEEWRPMDHEVPSKPANIFDGIFEKFTSVIEG